MTKLSAALFLIGLSASHAYAVAPCSDVCRGPNEPCSLRCYLPGPFVTTCDQVYGGACVPIGLTDSTNDEPTVCETTFELAPVVAGWVRAGLTATREVASAFRIVVG